MVDLPVSLLSYGHPSVTASYAEVCVHQTARNSDWRMPPTSPAQHRKTPLSIELEAIAPHCCTVPPRPKSKRKIAIAAHSVVARSGCELHGDYLFHLWNWPTPLDRFTTGTFPQLAPWQRPNFGLALGPSGLKNQIQPLLSFVQGDFGGRFTQQHRLNRPAQALRDAVIAGSNGTRSPIFRLV
jgi:hypothetical protein